MKENDKNLQVNVNEYLPLRDVVFNTLRQAIITGEFAPGERLMEISLANRLGVSRTPVREAIRKLELEGLVIMIPRKGAQVARITEKNLRDVIEIRTVLEEFAAGLACERITADGIAQLKNVHQQFIKSVENGDILDIVDKDELFHDTIFRATDNNRLLSIINNLREQFYRFRMEYVKDIRQRSKLVEEHRELLDAISSRDSARAKDLMHTHLLNQQQEVINNIQNQ
ncbi:MAG: GntR family transcriptional regulator [Eubacterium sp.]|nr:GntR family transcriptional regulator [Eubacterium sp.]MDD7208951.1 GntR family transcriptional regulator [Lachnospiraceae bacterium]MDY5496600.1 GntR family transcriptional regulator [Anaerobutyricum sp.]